MNEGERWTEFGQFLKEHRDRLGLSRREAAKRAEVPVATWRDLESGYTTSYGGVRVLPNPGSEVLDKIAAALEIPSEDLVSHVGRLSKPKKAAGDKAKDNSSPLAQKVARLDERDRRLVESLVDQMLERE